MTEEQIKQIAAEVFPGFEELQSVFIQGAQFEREHRDRDDEIEDLKHQLRKMQNERDLYRSAFRLNKNAYRWVSVKEELPKKFQYVYIKFGSDPKCRMSAVFIGTEGGENIFCPITLSGSRIGWSRDQAIYNVTHWMSILE